jgi:hypothetical protein
MNTTPQSVASALDTTKPLSNSVRASRLLVAEASLDKSNAKRALREQQIQSDVSRGYTQTSYARDNAAIAAVFNGQ